MHKVIIADDEMRARSLIRMLVPWEELELELLAECEDGDALCAKTEELSPDIIITDMRMPGLNGAALIRNLHTVFPACQIIVVSGFDDFEYMRQALVSKAVDYILKPIEEDALRAALENAICERKRLADEHKRNRREVLNQLIHGAAPVTEADCARYLEASQYTVLLIHLFETRAAEPYAVRQLIDTIHAEAAHFLSADGVVFRDDQNSNSICVILFVPVASVMEALSKIVFSLCRDAGIEAVFTCGQPFSEKRRIKRSYHQARAVLETYNVRLASDVAYYDGDADAPEAEVRQEVA